MKIQIPRKSLLLAATRIQGAIAERNLANFGIKASQDGIVTSSADRVMAVYSRFAGEVMEPGDVQLPAKFFSDVIRELPEGLVRLETDRTHLVVTAGPKDEFTMKIPLVEGVAWRTAPDVATHNSESISSVKLAYMFSQVQFCLEEDSPRNFGSVAYLHRVGPRTIRLVGTDAYRLSYCEVDTDLKEAFLPNGVCLSKRALAELTRMCHEGTPSIRLSVFDDGKALLAQTDDYQIFVRLSAVEYPDYAEALPQDKAALLQVNKTQLIGVARRVMLAADRTRLLSLDLAKSELTLSSKTQASCEGREVVSLSNSKNASAQVTINGKFLTDVLTNTVSADVGVFFKNSDEPVVIRPVDETEGCRSCHVLMPISEHES